MGISQEDINNLTAENAEGGAESEQAAGTAPVEGIREKYREGFALHLGNIFGTLTGEELKAVVKSEETVKADELQTALAGDWFGFLAHLEFNGDIATGHLLSVPIATFIAGKIMGQEPPEALEEAHTGALKEAANNLIGAWATETGEMVSADVKPAGEAELLEGDCGAALASAGGFAGDSAYIWRYALSAGGNEGEYVLVIPEAAMDKMVAVHPDYVAAAGEEEQPAVAAEEEEEEEAAPAEAEEPEEKKEVAVEKAVFQPFEGAAEVGESSQIVLLLDVPLTVSVELGRKRLSIKEVLEMVPGSLLELDKLAGEPVDLMVNGKLFAHGEVVVIDENFGVRISNIVSQKERLERLK